MKIPLIGEYNVMLKNSRSDSLNPTIYQLNKPIKSSWRSPQITCYTRSVTLSIVEQSTTIKKINIMNTTLIVKNIQLEVKS